MDPPIPTRAPAAQQGQDLDSPMLRAVWDRNRDEVYGRVEAIDRAVLALGEDEARARDGARAAHTLAGSLGMFGFRRAESAARELEEMLGAPACADPERASAALARLRNGLAEDSSARS